MAGVGQVYAPLIMWTLLGQRSAGAFGDLNFQMTRKVFIIDRFLF